MTTRLFRKTLRGVAASLFGAHGQNRQRLTRQSRSRRAALEPLESRQLLTLGGWTSSWPSIPRAEKSSGHNEPARRKPK